MNHLVLTIGHSMHSADALLQLLHLHQVTAIADIRSVPYSQHTPQFNRETLKTALQESGLSYVYLGDELGARPRDRNCYKDGKVQYKLLAMTPLFRSGLQRVITGSENYRIALLCVEKDPLLCPRSLLIARELEALSVEVSHILEDGRIETQTEAMERLLQQMGLAGNDLFRTREEVIDDACTRQEQRISYIDESTEDAAKNE